MMPYVLFILSVLCVPFCHALTDPWSVDVNAHTAVQRTYKQGEDVTMQISLRDGLKPLDLTGATARWYWYTNATANIWWTNSAAIPAPKAGLVTASWTPAMDTGASSYAYWVGIWMPGSTSPLWRVTGTIRMLTSPGFTPNAIPLPVRTLDFAAITVTNAPWVSAADWRSGSNALASAIQSGVASLAQVSAQTESNRVAIAAASAYSGPGWIDPTGGVWNVAYAPVLMDAAWMLTVTTPMWTAWDEEYGTNLIYTVGTYTYETFEHAPPVPLYHNAVDYTFDGRDVRINFSTSGYSMYLSYAMSGQNFTAATASTNLPVVLTASGAGVGQGTLWFRPAGWYPGSGPETVTSRVDTVAKLSDLAAIPTYPTNYIAGFTLPVPGTNVIYTLSVDSNRVLTVWEVQP